MYPAKVAAELAGITYRRLDYWARTGVIDASIPARGSGSRRRYSEDDVRALRTVATLAELLDLWAAGGAAAALRALPPSLRCEVRGVAPDGRLVLVGEASPAMFVALDLDQLGWLADDAVPEPLPPWQSLADDRVGAELRLA